MVDEEKLIRDLYDRVNELDAEGYEAGDLDKRVEFADALLHLCAEMISREGYEDELNRVRDRLIKIYAAALNSDDEEAVSLVVASFIELYMQDRDLNFKGDSEYAERLYNKTISLQYFAFDGGGDAIRIAMSAALNMNEIGLFFHAVEHAEYVLNFVEKHGAAPEEIINVKYMLAQMYAYCLAVIEDDDADRKSDFHARLSKTYSYVCDDEAEIDLLIDTVQRLIKFEFAVGERDEYSLASEIRNTMFDVQRSLFEDKDGIVYAMYCFIDCLRRYEDYDDAAEVVDAALKFYTARDGIRAMSVVIMLRSKGRLMSNLGRYQEEFDLLNRAVNVLARYKGSLDGDRLDMMREMIKALKRLKQTDETRALLEKHIEKHRDACLKQIEQLEQELSTLRADHEDDEEIDTRLRYLFSIATLCFECGMLNEAIQTSKRALKMFEANEHSPMRDKNKMYVLSNVIYALESEERHEEAQEYIDLQKREYAKAFDGEDLLTGLFASTVNELNRLSFRYEDEYNRDIKEKIDRAIYDAHNRIFDPSEACSAAQALNELVNTLEWQKIRVKY